MHHFLKNGLLLALVFCSLVLCSCHKYGGVIRTPSESLGTPQTTPISPSQTPQ